MTAATPAPASTRSLCALLTCFNRRDKTLACLHALGTSTGVEGLRLRAVLVDDASTDGSAAAVRAGFPWVQVIDGAGDLYWCRGMHAAFAHALTDGHALYLWLNDDTLLDPDALARLLACHDRLAQAASPADPAAAPIVLVGTTRDPDAGTPTYGGERRRPGLNPLSFELVVPAAHAQPIHTFNGNLVLVNAAAARRLGNLDPLYEHAMGDTDYGLRAGRAGVPVWLAEGTHGRCAHNPVQGTFRDRSLPLARRWRLMRSRKGLPMRSWWHFTRRHAGLWWPLLFAWPYLRLVAGALASPRRPAAGG
jgi:GT2 family glycosyltransferase